MLRHGRRLGISADTLEAVKIARLSRQLNVLPSQVRAERADDIEIFELVSHLDDERQRKNDQKTNL